MTAAPVLVTGAAAGIGRALCARLSAVGIPWIGWDVAADDADDSVVMVDVTDEEQVIAAAGRLPGMLSGVVTCAGVGARGALSDLPMATFRHVMEVNVVGTATVAKHALPLLRGSGRLVTIASVAGSVPLAERSAYCASKAAVIMLSKVLGSEWAPAGVSVVCVSPGFVDAGMAVHGLADGTSNLTRILERTPTGRLVQLENLLDVIVAILEGRLSGVTASEILVDDGFSSGARVS